jgi:hypothetical protein
MRVTEAATQHEEDDNDNVTMEKKAAPIWRRIGCRS